MKEKVLALKSGWVEVICGGMFSGKTEELIARVNRAKRAKQNTLVIKPAQDTRWQIDPRRYPRKKIASYSGAQLSARLVRSPREILSLVGEEPRVAVVGIDEVNLFDSPREVVRVCEKLADRGLRVIVAGLDMNFRGEPFPPTPRLAAEAEFVDKLHAICVCCGSLASRTIRKREVGEEKLIQIGGEETYAAVCRDCHRLYMEGEIEFPEQS